MSGTVTQTAHTTPHLEAEALYRAYLLTALERHMGPPWPGGRLEVESELPTAVLIAKVWAATGSVPLTQDQVVTAIGRSMEGKGFFSEP